MIPNLKLPINIRLRIKHRGKLSRGKMNWRTLRLYDCKLTPKWGIVMKTNYCRVHLSYALLFGSEMDATTYSSLLPSLFPRSTIVLLSCHEILIFDSENQWKSIHILRKKGIQKWKGSSTEQAKAAAAASDRKWDDIPSIAENKRTIFYIPDLLRLFICTLGEDRFLFYNIEVTM